MDDEDEFELLRYQVRRFDRCVIAACLIAFLAVVALIQFAKWCLSAGIN